MSGRLRQRRQAAARLHHQRLRQPMGGRLLTQRPQIATGRRPQVGVDRRGRCALVLAVLGRQLVRRDHEHTFQPRAQELRHTALVLRVRVGVQQADRDGLHAGLPQRTGRPLHGSLVQRPQHSVRPHPLVHLDRHLGKRSGPRNAGPVQQRPRLPRQRQQIPEPAGGHEPGHGSAALQQRVGGHGGAVPEVAQRPRRQPGLLQRSLHALDHRPRLIVDRGRQLHRGQPALVHQRHVGERAAHIDPGQRSHRARIVSEPVSNTASAAAAFRHTVLTHIAGAVTGKSHG